MPSTRRRPNTVASQATAGAMKICEPMPDVDSHAPSSKESEKAPRRSGRPTVVRRLSKLARKAPRSTAMTAQNGYVPTLPSDTGPRPSSFPVIAGIDPRHDRHALHDLGEIAGGVVGRQQRELRAAGGRDPLHAAVQCRVRKTVHRDFDG